MHDTTAEVFYTILLVSIFAAVLVITLITAAILYYNRRKAQLEERSKFTEQLLTSQLEIQETTMKNISQEIHDNIGQTLSLARLNLNMMALEENTTVSRIQNSQELLGKAIQDLRDLAKTLDTDVILEGGLINAIEFLLDILRKSGGLEASLIIKGDSGLIDPRIELILFRTVQEAINNIVKHSSAKIVKVVLIYDTINCLQITDNGKGFDPNGLEKRSQGGLGLRNMRSRIELIGGTFTINSVINGGTMIEITFPNDKL